MVECARQKGISAAAREFKTTRKTLRKWIVRYQALGATALLERSRRPQHSPKQISPALEVRIIRLRKKYPRWGAFRLKDHFHIPCSSATVARVLKRQGLIRKRDRKWKQKKDLSELKALLKPFERVQVDVKHLYDIANYWKYCRGERLPSYEFTARDVRTGATFVGLAWQPSLGCALDFIERFLEHLKAYGVDLKGVTIQTDHGTEFDMAQPTHWAAPERSHFARRVMSWGARYQAIPIKRPTFNSDVESFHRLIEDEFYSLEPVRGIQELMEKVYAYTVYFNCFRNNRHKEGKNPQQILQELCLDTDSRILLWQPLLLGLNPQEKAEKKWAQEFIRATQTKRAKLDTLL